MLSNNRLYSDPNTTRANKFRGTRTEMQALRTRYIMENYDPVKKQLMGLPPTPAQPIDINQLPKKESSYSLWNAITSSYTWIPIFSFFTFALAYSLCARDGFLLWLQRNSFIIVLFTLVPLAMAVVTSSAGKALGNMTPGNLQRSFSRRLRRHSHRALQRSGRKLLGHTARTRHRAVAGMAILPFVPFFALKDLARCDLSALTPRFTWWRCVAGRSCCCRRFCAFGDWNTGGRRVAA